MRRSRIWRWLPSWLLFGLPFGLHVYIATASTYTLLNWFQIDDAFYYFVVARNIARGVGVTFDGLGPTNGFHPLWMALLVPIFALFRDLYTPLRAVVVLTGALHGLTGVVLYRAGRRVFRPGVAWLLAIAWVWSPRIFRLFSVGGIESALNALTLAYLWDTSLVLWLAAPRAPARAWTRWGWALALSMLARLDNVFLAGGMVLWMVLGPYRTLWWEGLRSRRWGEVVRWGLRWAGPPLVLVGGYLLWSAWYVGGVLPVSARVKRWWGTFGSGTPYGAPIAGPWPLVALRSTFDPSDTPWPLVIHPLWNAYQTHAVRWGLPPISTWRDGLHLALVGMAILAPFLWLTRRWWWPVARRSLVLPWLLFAEVHGVYYDISRHMAQRHWYWVMQALGLYLAAATLVEGLVDALAQRWPRARRWGWAVVLVLSLWAGVRYTQYVIRSYPWHRPGDHLYERYARWVEAHTEPGARIAATGAGALAYFIRDREVINLDGLISNYAYVRALEAGHRVTYLADVGVDYLLIGRAFCRNPKECLELTEPYASLTPYASDMVAEYYDPEEGWRIHLRRFHPPGGEGK